MNIQLEEILNRLITKDNRIALQAIRELRDRGWLEDGALQGAAFCKVNIHDANLENADLCCAGFHQANLSWADLSNADLRAAKLSLCDLSGSNMKNTKLDSADLYKANLRGARNLTDEQLRKVSRLCGAIMPNGALYDGRFQLSGDFALAEWQNINISDPAAMAEFYGVPVEVYTLEKTERVPV
jgi:uncharacterized protein YjbI with pentapeptide repeats